VKKIVFYSTLSGCDLCHVLAACFESTASIGCFNVQGVKQALASSSALTPPILQLKDFYMTNTITRLSPTMARCARAVVESEKNSSPSTASGTKH